MMNFIDDLPREIDICMGKGHGVGSRTGNQQYYAYIVATVPRYIAMEDPVSRSALFREIVHTMKNDQQRRFLQKDAGSGRYFEVSDSVAQAKVGQVCRRIFSLLLLICRPIHHDSYSSKPLTFCERTL
jgi:hypothetical protein